MDLDHVFMLTFHLNNTVSGQYLVLKVYLLPVSCQFDYYNSMLINRLDEDGNSVDLGGEFPLEENEHFNNMRVNTQQSNIQVPTNVYNKGQGLPTAATGARWVMSHSGHLFVQIPSS